VNNVNRVSFNGGPHGIQVRESERERVAEHEHHFEPRREQIEHEHAAHADRSQWASVNHGRPGVAASARPGDFHRDVVAARPENGNRPEASHRSDRPADRPSDRRDNNRADRPSNASSAHNDRPSSAVNRDSSASRQNSVHNNARDAREVRPVQDAQRSRSQSASGPRGNPHDDRAPAHGNASHENASHQNAPHSNEKPEHNKPEHNKPEHP
jgi:hypothetical protein